MQSGSRTFAASFIVTVSMLTGCGGNQSHEHQNPPAPDDTVLPTQNPPGIEDHDHDDGHHDETEPHKNPPAPDASTGHDHINPPAPQPSPTAALSPAPAGWTVSTRADGTCWANAKSSCPEGARCNPPAPRQVSCP